MRDLKSSPGPAGRSLPWRSLRRLAVVAAVVAALVYANALGNGFAYDDVHIVVDDESLAEPGAFPERLLQPYWPDDAAGDLGLWRPLTTAAFAVQRQLVGLEPAVFHGVNVLLHGLVTAMVVLLAGAFVAAPAAFMAGLVFAVHPVHVEAVANVVGLAELLAAVPYLGACLLFLRAGGDGSRRRPADPEGRPESSLAVIAGLCVLYAVAFLTKESAVTLPAALVVLDLVRRPVPLSRAGAYLRRRGPLLAALAVTAVVVLALRWTVLGSVADPDPPLGARRLLETPRIWTLGVVWLHYLRLLVVPAELSSDYSPGVVPVLTVWTPAAVAGVAAALAVLGGTWTAWRVEAGRSRDAGDPVAGTGPGRLPMLAVAWFLVTVSPVSNVFFVSGVLLAERTLYLPSVGFAVAAGWLLARLVRRRGALGRALVTATLLLMTARTWTRTPTWESTERVFLTLAEERPRAGRAQWMVGDMLATRGEVASAKRYWARAVGLLDSSPWLLREVGWDAVERGEERLGEALLLAAWREERPAKIAVARRLALLYSRQARHAEAATFARRVVEREPENVPFWHILAGALEASGELEAALAARERVIELGEDPWQQWLSVARLHLTLGDGAAAKRALEEALRRAPGAAEREAIEDAFTPVDPPSSAVEGGG